MNVPAELKYTKSHEWVRDENGIAVVGITDFAQQEMTELVFVELPETGRTVEAGDEVAVVESVKSASDIYAPVSGEITEVNDALTDNPSTVNEQPFTDGWMMKIRMSDAAQLDQLMNAAAYQQQIES